MSIHLMLVLFWSVFRQVKLSRSGIAYFVAATRSASYASWSYSLLRNAEMVGHVQASISR